MKITKEEFRGRKRTVERQSLDKANLLELIKYNSLKEISDIYGVSISAVSQQLTYIMNQKKVGFIKNNFNLQSEEYLFSVVKEKKDCTWLGSAERNVMIDNGLMEFQRKKLI